MLSDEKAARLMAALRRGQTPRTVGVRLSHVAAYLLANPDYAREARPLIEANRKAAYLRKGAYLREKTHCVNGHSLAEHGRVAVHKGWMTRQCRACEKMRYHRGGIIRTEVLKKVTARIGAGASLNSFTTAGTSGYLVKFSTLARYRRENPTFERLVMESMQNRLYRAPMVVAGTFHYEWDPADAQAIPAMLPDRFPGKNDVVQSIFVELIEGRLDRKLLKHHIRRFVIEYNRQHPGKFARFGAGRLLSLDEVMFDGGTTTRGDTVSRGLWD